MHWYVRTKNIYKIKMQKIKCLTLVLTTRCNSMCTHCDIWQQPNQDISNEIAINIINDPLIKNLNHLELSGGEPFLWSNLEQIINHISNTL